MTGRRLGLLTYIRGEEMTKYFGHYIVAPRGLKGLWLRLTQAQEFLQLGARRGPGTFLNPQRPIAGLHFSR
jgi:hypothetical protein